MATVSNKDGNDEFPADPHLESKLEKIANNSGVDTSDIVSGLSDVKDSIDAQTPILDDIKTNTTPVEP